MIKRSRRIWTDVLKAGMLGLWGILIFDMNVRCQSADQLFLEAVFPQAVLSDTRGQSVLSAITGLVQSWIFPGTSYVSSQMTAEDMYENEMYPSQADLEAFCEENSQYESLEAEAEKKLEEMNQTVDNSALESGGGGQNTVQNDGVTEAVSRNNRQPVYERASLLDYQFLLNNFYVVDSSTSCDKSVLQPEVLLDKDLTIDLTGNDPKILIYHTHSQESFADSAAGAESDTVLGLGDLLTDILQQKYGVAVYHDRGVYDMINGQLDRSEAYSKALPAVEQILSKNPSIKVVIDLHRDGVSENTRLVTTIDGKPTAKIMFFNGLCRGASSGTNGYIQNPYLEDNLAFSLQMQLKAAEKYPDFTRRIYLRSYRYNMHVMPRTLLIECGAQTNTVEEVQNAMEPLADILVSVLSGT
ncbi:MAG: stage II sporulation protein P [Clostridiales bacterium]|nr:stage II sporulation protein P [Clostridiales bacterium]